MGVAKPRSREHLTIKENQSYKWDEGAKQRKYKREYMGAAKALYELKESCHLNAMYVRHPPCSQE